MVVLNPTVREVIENNPLALATVNPDSTPNVIGVACVKVVARNQILITDNFMKQTRKNILGNNNVCIAVWDKKWNGYKLIGKASYYASGVWKRRVEKIPENKGLAAKGAIIVKISKIIDLC